MWLSAWQIMHTDFKGYSHHLHKTWNWEQNYSESKNGNEATQEVKNTRKSLQRAFKRLISLLELKTGWGKTIATHLCPHVRLKGHIGALHRQLRWKKTCGHRVTSHHHTSITWAHVNLKELLEEHHKKNPFAMKIQRIKIQH